MNDSEILLKKLTTCFFNNSLSFTSEDLRLLTWDLQERLLKATVNSDINTKYSTSAQFTKSYLKKIMDYLEKSNVDIHDGFFVKLCETMQKTNEDYYYQHYLMGSNTTEVITIKETNKMVVNGTTGLKTWEAGLMLADWALSNKEVFVNKDVLELGSGVGFTGITIAKYCNPKSIYLTDCHPEVLKAINDNVIINFPSLQQRDCKDGHLFQNGDNEIGVCYLDWNNTNDVFNCKPPDIAIGADIVYDPEIIKPLCHILQLLFKMNNNLQVFIASVIRNTKTFQTFLDTLESSNLSYEKISLSKSGFIEWDQDIEKCLLKIIHR